MLLYVLLHLSILATANSIPAWYARCQVIICCLCLASIFKLFFIHDVRVLEFSPGIATFVIGPLKSVHLQQPRDATAQSNFNKYLSETYGHHTRNARSVQRAQVSSSFLHALPNPSPSHASKQNSFTSQVSSVYLCNSHISNLLRNPVLPHHGTYVILHCHLRPLRSIMEWLRMD